MPRTIQADGRTVQVPDDATPDEINSIFGPAPASHIGDLRAGDSSPMWAPGQLGKDKLTRIEHGYSGETLAHKAARFTGNIGAGGMGVALHPVQTLEGIGDSVLHPIDTLKSTYEGLNTEPAEIVAPLIGQAAVIDAGSKATPPILRGVGSGLKATAGKLADVTALGSDALDRQYGASPGRGISGNRIVAATKAGLKKQVDASIEPLADQRSSLLAKSQAGPTDIRADVDQPFADLTTKIASKTGVADPAEVRALTRTRAAIGFQQDPFTGEPMQDPVSKTPVVRDLEHMSPAEMADFNTHLRSMGNYVAKDSPLADQAVKQAGFNLRGKLAEVSPESVPLTDQLHNTETAQDILQRQLRGAERTELTPRSTMFGTMMSNVAAPLTRLAGTAAAAGMDWLGSGMRSLADKLSPPGPPAAPTQKGTGQLRLGPGGGGGPIITPPPAPSPVPPELPANAGPNVPPRGNPPPNAGGLTERVAARPGELLGKVGARPGKVAPAPGVGGVEGDGFRITPKQLEAQNGTSLQDKVADAATKENLKSTNKVEDRVDQIIDVPVFDQHFPARTRHLLTKQGDRPYPFHIFRGKQRLQAMEHIESLLPGLEDNLDKAQTAEQVLSVRDKINSANSLSMDIADQHRSDAEFWRFQKTRSLVSRLWYKSFNILEKLGATEKGFSSTGGRSPVPEMKSANPGSNNSLEKKVNGDTK